MILERMSPQANWYAGLEVALTRPFGVPERRLNDDPWNPDPVDRPRRISDDLAWFRSAMDHPPDAGLTTLDEALPSTWTPDPDASERLLRLDERGVLGAIGFTLHQPDFVESS